jgi:hypothetical protein
VVDRRSITSAIQPSCLVGGPFWLLLFQDSRRPPLAALPSLRAWVNPGWRFLHTPGIGALSPALAPSRLPTRSVATFRTLTTAAWKRLAASPRPPRSRREEIANQNPPWPVMQAGPPRTALENYQEWTGQRRPQCSRDRESREEPGNAALRSGGLPAIRMVSPRVFLRGPATRHPTLAKEKP